MNSLWQPNCLSIVIAFAFSSAYAQTVPDKVNLNEITVKGARNTPVQSNGNYTVKGSTSATKLDLKLKETPQSVTVFTQQQMQDQNLQNLDQVLEETPGITVLQDSVTGMGEAQYYSRGFPVDNYQLDGVLANKYLLGGPRFIAAQDSYLYDRVEIIRGSNGLSTGVGDPAASVNFVRKRPMAKSSGELNLKYGSWNNKRVEFDYGGALNKSQTLRGRVVGTWEDGDSFMDRIKRKSHAFYTVFDWTPTDKDSFTLGFSRQHRNITGAPTKGLMRYSKVTQDYDFELGDSPMHWIDARDVPPSFNNGAEWAFNKATSDNMFAEYKHHFNDHIKLQTAYTRSRTKSDLRYGDMGVNGYAPQFNAATYDFGRERDKYDDKAFDIHLDSRFKLFDQDQQFIVGFSGIRHTQTRDDYNFSSSGELNVDDAKPTGIAAMTGEPIDRNFYLWQAIPLDYWNNGSYPMLGYNRAWEKKLGPDGLISRDHLASEQYGPYFALKLKPARWLTAVIGGRWLTWRDKGGGKWSFYKNKNNVITDDTVEMPDEGYAPDHNKSSMYHDTVRKFVPYGGVIVELTPTINAYVSYTGILKTNNVLRNRPAYGEGGGWLPPITGNSKEVGIKGGLWNDKLNFALSYFTMTQKNYPTLEPTGSRCYEWKYGGENGNEPWCFQGDWEYGTGKGYTSRGFDINLAGQITPKWRMQAGFVKLKIDKPYDAPNSSNDLGDDMNLEYGGTYTAPDKTFKFFTSYDFTPKLTMGVGMRWVSGTKPKPWGHGLSNGQYYVSDKPKALWQPSYSIWNVMARYKINKYAALAINVGNLTNKRYYTNSRSNFYGKPRNASVALKIKW